MRKRLLIAGLAVLSALALSAVTASGASAAATAYTVGSATAIPAEEGTGWFLDSLSNWTLTTEQAGTSIVLTGTGAIDCGNCMLHNQDSPMDVTGSTGGLTFTGVTVNLPNCAVEFPGSGSGNFATLALNLTASNPGSLVLSTVGGTFAEFKLTGVNCAFGGTTFVVKGTSVTGSVTADVLTINSTTDLTVNKKAATLTGNATITAGTTTALYHPIELKAS